MTTRRRIGTRERANIFLSNGGRCHLCGGLITTGQPWEVSHDTPLELGGADEGDNLKPAHAKCHRAHTATVDIPQIRLAQRREAKHIGAKAPSRNPLPGSKASGWKRTFSNGWVRRRSEP